MCSAVLIAALLMVNAQIKGQKRLKLCSTSYWPNIILNTQKRNSKLLCFGLPLGNPLCSLFLHLSSHVRSFWRLLIIVANCWLIVSRLWSGYGGLEVACWPLVPKFAGSNPAEAVGFFRAKNSSASFGREVKPFVPGHIFAACKRTRK